MLSNTALASIEMRGETGGSRPAIELKMVSGRCLGIFIKGDTHYDKKLRDKLQAAGIYPESDGTYELGESRLVAIERLRAVCEEVCYIFHVTGSELKLEISAIQKEGRYYLFVSDNGSSVGLFSIPRWEAYAKTLTNGESDQSKLLIASGLSFKEAIVFITASVGLDCDLEAVIMAIAGLCPNATR